ncbi:MAG TPA: tetratricopeptide repeat protein, partial [Gemmataceae bacterium]|nr:tetratricopeptide repeat protein [Gemmataceae bacterium]
MTPARLRWLTAALAGLALCAGGMTRAADDAVLNKALTAGGRARQAGNWDEALRIYKEADAATPDATGPTKAWLLSDLAFTYLQLGLYQDAGPCYARSAKLYSALYDDAGDGQRARVGGWLSTVLKSQGYCEELLGNGVAAEQCLRRSLDLARQHRKPDDPFFARALTQLGALYREMGRDDEAGGRLREALRRTSPDAPEHAAALNELGQLHFQQAQAQPGKRAQFFGEAEREFKEARQELEAAPRADAVVLGACLNNLAWLYQAQGRNEEAEEAYKRCLELLTEKLGKGHPRVAKAESNLGWLYFQTGRDEEARQHFDRSLEVREKRFAATSPDHPELAFSRLNLALLDARQDRWGPALRQADQARHSLARYQQANLPFLSEPEQLEFLALERDDVYRSVALGVARPADDGAADLSAEWALNAKGVSVRVSALRALLGRDRRDPRMSELVGVRTRLANLTLRGAAAGQAEEQRRQIGELEEREQDLIRRLGGDVARLMGDDPWVSLAAVRAAVPRGAVLIEVAKFDAGVLRPSAAAGTGQALHYGAWVVPAAGEGKVRVVDLGDVGPVDDAVAAVRAAIDKAPDDIHKLKERAAEAAFRKTLAPLDNLLLQPLQKQAGVEDKERWIISPEGSLWLVPWEMLPLPGNR